MTSHELTAFIPKTTKAHQHGSNMVFEISQGELRPLARMYAESGVLRLVMMLGIDDRDREGDFKVFYVFGAAGTGRFLVPFVRASKEGTYPSIAREIHGASMYERIIKESFGLTAEGHPGALQPHRLHAPWPIDAFPMRKDAMTPDENSGESIRYDFAEIGGEGIYEVPVGPVHAGIIEPGHFRFSMAGEEIISLEPRLGWVHKGTEKLFESRTIAEQLKLAERVAGDTSFTHATAYAQAIEDLAGIAVPERAAALRVVFSEIERIANHVSDIGFIMGDTGFNFGGAHCSRIRERVMRVAERATGHRFLRDAAAIGGVHTDLDAKAEAEIAAELADIERDFTEVMRVADESTSLYNRLVGTGTVPEEAARDHCAVGVAARASGIATDVRKDFPYAAYAKFPITLPETKSGDVHARYRVRIHEAFEAFRVIQAVLAKLPKGAARAAVDLDRIALRKQSYALGLTEGWRGEIAYFVATDAAGKIVRVSPRDPSFIDWHLAPIAAAGSVLLDFPLINKSFNMSYSGNDL